MVDAEPQEIITNDNLNASVDAQETMNKVVKAENEKIHAEGEAEAIKLVNEAADKYFVGNAQLLRKLEALETSLGNNAKIVVPTGTELVNIIGEMAGIIPLDKNKKDSK